MFFTGANHRQARVRWLMIVALVFFGSHFWGKLMGNLCPNCMYTCIWCICNCLSDRICGIYRCFFDETLQRKSTLFQMEGLHTSLHPFAPSGANGSRHLVVLWPLADGTGWAHSDVKKTTQRLERVGKRLRAFFKKWNIYRYITIRCWRKRIVFLPLIVFFLKFLLWLVSLSPSTLLMSLPPKKTCAMNSTPSGRGFMNFKQKLCGYGWIVNHHEFSIKVLFDLIFVVVGGEGDRLSLTIKPWMGRFSDQTAIVDLALIQV